jgi:hypothetical protein
MKILTRILATIILFASCSDENGASSNSISHEEISDILFLMPEVTPWTPEEEIDPGCIDCDMYFCPPLDSVWQKEICFNVCDDPPTVYSETECIEFMECDPTQYLIDSLSCTTGDGYPGTQDKVCNKGKIQYTDCISDCGEEACNNLDDDCDGNIDEGQTNICGECGIVPTEICDNVDNDCDGEIDEEMFQSCVTACGSGYEMCNAGNWVSCSAPQPADEICDGVDNDCDGQVDEGLECICTIQDVGTLFPCAEAPLKCGQGYKTCECLDPSCSEIVTTDCLALCYWLPPANSNNQCDPLIGMPLEEEKCNNFDDNCNQIIDEDLLAGCYTGPSGTLMAGICLPGNMICEDGSWGHVNEQDIFVPGYCKGEITPQEEICNGLDDDCDGVIDFGEEMKETDILFVVDWSGSMVDEISAVMIALNQFANNFSDEQVLQWGLVKGPIPNPSDNKEERLEIAQNLTGFSNFLNIMAGLDTSSNAMNGTKEMFLDAIYLAVSNISANLMHLISDLAWSGLSNPSLFAANVVESDPALKDFVINWRPGVDRIIIIFSDEGPQSYLIPKLSLNDVKNAVAATPQLKTYTFSKSGSDQQKWEQIANAGNGEWYVLSSNPTEMYVSLMEILNEACKSE